MMNKKYIIILNEFRNNHPSFVKGTNMPVGKSFHSILKLMPGEKSQIKGDLMKKILV